MTRILLEVPYLSQLDSNTTQGGRMCFSSTCAMMLNYLKPKAIVQPFVGDQKDDIYLTKLNRLGYDSTDAQGQLATLKSYGFQATYHQNGNWEDVNSLLAKGIPVPVGILHKGNILSPTGGGHWVLIVGHSADGLTYYVNDPAGELDLVQGGYHVTNNGKMRKYSKENLGKRWMIEGSGSGWYVKGSKA